MRTLSAGVVASAPGCVPSDQAFAAQVAKNVRTAASFRAGTAARTLPAARRNSCARLGYRTRALQRRPQAQAAARPRVGRTAPTIAADAARHLERSPCPCRVERLRGRPSDVRRCGAIVRNAGRLHGQSLTASGRAHVPPDASVELDGPTTRGARPCSARCLPVCRSASARSDMRQVARHLAARRLRRAPDMIPERDVRRLVVRGSRVRHVIRQRADRGRRAAATTSASPCAQRGRVQPGQQSGRRRFDVAFDAGHLAGEKQRWAAIAPARSRRARSARSRSVLRWTMPKRTNSACFEPGINAQHARLIAPLDLGLKSHEAEMIAGAGCPAAAARRRAARGPSADRSRPTGFIGPKRSVSAPRCAITSIGRQPSKKRLLVEVVDRRRLRRASAHR